MKQKEKQMANESADKTLTRHTKGPEPERLKVSGYKNWEDAVAPILGKRRPPGAWSK
jgi:hypothetical protein